MSTVAVPADDRPLALTRSRTNVVFVTILLGMLLAALDQTIVSTALPTIVADLGGAGHMAWVVTAYILAEAVSTVLAGKFGDLFGRRLVFQVSPISFVGASSSIVPEPSEIATVGLAYFALLFAASRRICRGKLSLNPFSAPCRAGAVIR